jgi:hypothetical protein
MELVPEAGSIKKIPPGAQNIFKSRLYVALTPVLGGDRRGAAWLREVHQSAPTLARGECVLYPPHLFTSSGLYPPRCR